MIGVKSIYYEKDNGSLIINIDNEKITIQNNNILLKLKNNEIIFKYLDSLYSIIDNWQKEYIDIRSIDGGTWKLSINYIDGSKREYFGKSSYPNNFEAFERLNRELINEVQNG